MNKNIYFTFFFKCILALMPVIVFIIYTAVLPFGYMDEEYPSWKYTKDIEAGRGKLSENEGPGDITLILGDSRAMADLIPEDMDKGVYNLAVGGATGVEMYYTLKHYIENESVPENVIIMFAPFHYSYMDNFWTRSVYFHHLTLPEAIKVYSEGIRLDSNAVCERDKGLSSIISMYLCFPDSYMPAALNSGFIGRYQANRQAYEDISQSRGHGLFGTEEGSSELNYEANYTELDTGRDYGILKLYMERLLSLCRDNEIRTILVQPPMNEASYESLNDDYVSQFSGLIESFKELYPEAEISSEIPCYDNGFFGDASHLNEKGAIKYTKEFMNEYDL